MQMNLLKHIALVSAIALVPAWAMAQSTAPGTGTTPAAKGEAGKGDRGQRGERMKAADKDGDGAISKAEADAAGMTRLSKNFDKLDTNKDGKLTRDEMKMARQEHRGEHKGEHKGAHKHGATPATPAAPTGK